MSNEHPEPDGWAILYESGNVYSVHRSEHEADQEFSVGGLEMEDHDYEKVPLFRAEKLEGVA